MNLCHFRNAFLSLILIQCQADNEVGRGLDSIAGSVFLFVFCVNKKLSDKILQMGKANNLQVVIAQSYGGNSICVWRNCFLRKYELSLSQEL